MKIFIWRNVENLTRNWHSDGGLVVVAASLEEARKALAAKDLKNQDGEPCEDVFRNEPDATYDLQGSPDAKMFFFPNAGCC